MDVAVAVSVFVTVAVSVGVTVMTSTRSQSADGCPLTMTCTAQSPRVWYSLWNSQYNAVRSVGSPEHRKSAVVRLTARTVQEGVGPLPVGVTENSGGEMHRPRVWRAAE